MTSAWQVRHERVVRREAPSKDSKLLGYELRGKVVIGEEVSVEGVPWLKIGCRGSSGQSASYMMIDGTSGGLGKLLEPFVKPSTWKVQGERVALRTEPSTSAQILGFYCRGKKISGAQVEVSGAQWVQSETRDGQECFLLVDGTSLGVGILLRKAEVADPYDDGVECTPVQLKLAEAATALADALKNVPAELELETRPKARLMLAIEVLGSTLHTVMDMDFAGRTRTIEDGMRLAKNGLKMAKDSCDVAGEAMAMDIVANAYLLKGQADYAMKVAKEALPLLRRAGNKNGEARTLTTLANCSCAKASRVMGGKRAESMQNLHPDKLTEFKRAQSEQIEAALAYAEDALFLVKGKDPRLEVLAMLKIAVIDLSGGNAEKAKDTIDEAAAIAMKADQLDLNRQCMNHSVDCVDIHMKRGEWSDAADIASELGAAFKAEGNRFKASEMIKIQIQAHVAADEGQWALAAAKNDLLRLWTGFDKKQEALGLHEVAKIYLAMREPANAVATGRAAIDKLEKDEVQTQARFLRTMMQAFLVDEDKQDFKAALKIAKECLNLGKTSCDKSVEAYGMLWMGRVQGLQFFKKYIPKITLWRSSNYVGKRKEKDLKLKDYESAMRLVDDAYLMFESLQDEEGMQEAFEIAYALQQKVNSTQDPAQTTHVFKNGAYDHSERSFDYEAVRKKGKENVEMIKNTEAALVE